MSVAMNESIMVDAKTPPLVVGGDYVSPSTASSIVMINEEDMTKEERKEYREKLAAVKSANRRASLAGSVGGIFLERKLPGFVEAYNNVRPLVVRLTAMSTVGAYRSYKLLCQLQRIVGDPYLPDLSEAIPIVGKTRDQALFMERAARFCGLAAAAYPAYNLLKYELTLVENLEESTEDIIKKLIPKAEFVRRKELAASYAPSYSLIADHCTKEMIVLIQGSTEAPDWVTNLMCDPTGNDNGSHEGMRRAANNIDEEIREELLEYLKTHKKYNIVLTGHSLGAGVAALLAMKWLDEVPKQYQSRIHCLAFACPCVIPLEKAGRYDKNITTVVFGRDIVPRLSFGSMRDLLVIMQALSRYMKATAKKGRPIQESAAVLPEDAIDGGGSVSVGSSSGEGVLWGPKLSETESALFEDEAEIEYLSNRRSSLSLDSDDFGRVMSLDVKFEGLSSAEKKEQMEALALSLATTTLEMPLSFNQITTILKRRVAELNDKIAAQRVSEGPKKMGFFARLGWKLVKLTAGGCRSTHDPVDVGRAEEDRLLRECLEEIKKLRCPLGDRTLVVPGACVLIVPKLHYIEAGASPEIPYNKGQCVLYKLPKQCVKSLSEDPAWLPAGMVEHTLPYYLQGLACQHLSKFPIQAAVAVAKTRSASIASRAASTKGPSQATTPATVAPMSA